jgi:hypothetical protein
VLVVPLIAAPPPDAWITTQAMVTAGGVLEIDFGTRPVGHGVIVDEYLLVTAPDGRVWSISPRGALSPPGRLVPRARSVVRGATATTSRVAIREPGRLGEAGPGAVELVIVLPGGNPLDRQQIIAWDRAPWRLLR